MGIDGILDELTEPQREAVTTTEGPLLVLAGPGSGKTRVITRRAAYIARTAARPDQVLAITFTNKAAGEMRDRIGAMGVGGRMWVRTFHSLCARLLREYGETIGVNPRFSIFDESDQREVVRAAIAACNLTEDNWRPRVVLGQIGDAKNQMLEPARYAERAYDYSTKTIARIYAEYQRLLVEQNGCDFDDLLLYTARLLMEHAAVRDELTDRFRYVLIDEYQDTNHAQYLIATQLAAGHRNICVTGDPDQSIYAWRGADIRNILAFESDYPDAKTVRLEQNYRSVGSILSAAARVIECNTQRKKKELWTENEVGAAVRVWECDDAMEEAERIAADIRAHCADGGEPGDVAIFYRINALTRVLEDGLRAARVPYQIARGVEFYGRKEIKDVLAYVRAVVNPADELSVLRAINTPARGIGLVTVERLRSHARQTGTTVREALAGAERIANLKSAKKKVVPFAAILDRLERLPQRPVKGFLDAVLKESGLEDALRAEGDIDNDALDNVQELVSAAQQYDVENPDGSVADWLHQISLVSDVDAVEASGGAVTLMTLHAAKGLEFPAVYIIGLEEELLPHARALRGDDNALEEERRLCFVGMTRAKQRLTLTRARYRMVRGLTQRTVSSRFLGELPGDEIEFSGVARDEGRSYAHLASANDTEDTGTDLAHWQPGRRVRHPVYGDGRVLARESRGGDVVVRIDFDAGGNRTFMLDYATLELVEQ